MAKPLATPSSIEPVARPSSRKRLKTNEWTSDETNVSSTSHEGSIRTGRRRLQFLKTKAELRAAHETVDVYVTEIPMKAASAVLSIIKQGIPGYDTMNLQHLRRFVKPEFLPAHLTLAVELTSVKEKASVNAVEENNEDPADKSAAKPEITSHLFICPISWISLSALTALLTSKPPFLDAGKPPLIRSIPVPAHAPTSAEQAAQWSLQYWPISYKNTNPYGPHPSIVQRAEVQMRQNLDFHLSLADQAAKQSSEQFMGEATGCVVVERTNGKTEVVAVAGDARWYGAPYSERRHPGNVCGHAVMRAIGIVAKKRLRLEAAAADATKIVSSLLLPPSAGEKHLKGEISLDHPLTELEEYYYKKDTILPNGYLCVDLEIYITHEPCVMCSMAILHSRFARCVFGKRMLLTGAMTADTKPHAVQEGKRGLEHGLFWRPSELNWKFLCWEIEKELEEDETEEFALGEHEHI